MELHELAPIAGSTQVGKRKGRGTGTGNGKTAGRGHKVLPEVGVKLCLKKAEWGNLIISDH